MTENIDGHATDILAALRDYAAAAREASLAGLVQLRIGETDLKAMRYLIAAPGSLSRDLARHLAVSSASVTTLVDRLADKGLLRREPSTTDRRTVHLFATVSADQEPWSSLDRFDQRAGAVASEWPADVVQGAAALIVEMTRRGRTA